MSTYRGALLLYTCVSILAVDFPAFPRRYAKAEAYGTGGTMRRRGRTGLGDAQGRHPALVCLPGTGGQGEVKGGMQS